MDHFAGAPETADRLLSWRLVVAIFLALIALASSIAARHFQSSDAPPLDFIELQDPRFRFVFLLETVTRSSVAYDGTNVQPATRVHLSLHYVPLDRSDWRAGTRPDKNVRVTHFKGFFLIWTTCLNPPPFPTSFSTTCGTYGSDARRQAQPRSPRLP